MSLPTVDEIVAIIQARGGRPEGVAPENWLCATCDERLPGIGVDRTGGPVCLPCVIHQASHGRIP